MIVLAKGIACGSATAPVSIKRALSEPMRRYIKFASKSAQGLWRRINVCGSYLWTCKGGCGDATQSLAPMFHCAGKEPGTGSAQEGNADNNMAASVSSTASRQRETKRTNSLASQWRDKGGAASTIDIKVLLHAQDANRL